MNTALDSGGGDRIYELFWQQIDYYIHALPDQSI
jgi:hypothetical protein